MSVSSPSGRIAVAVSGGADSLYSLLSLKEQGHDVLAVHGLFLREQSPEAGTAAQAVRERLAAACDALGVQLVIVDLREPFEALVIRPFVQAYALGLTPNPCALCNAGIKFGLLLDAARAKGAERLATGHYARLDRDRSGVPALYQASDPAKDQSYFLSLVPAHALARTVFPLHGSIKRDVLAVLRDRGIPVPQPGESQEVCFVPGDDYRLFVPRMAGRFGIPLPGPGPMRLTDDRQLGVHQGLWQYTEGQRKGLGIGWKEPLHVLAKELENNILRLGPKREMQFSGLECENVNLLLPPERWPDTVLVKTRYRERPKKARIEEHTSTPGRLRIRFEQPENAVAPGQVVTIYVPGGEETAREETTLRVAAGGIIASGFAAGE